MPLGAPTTYPIAEPTSVLAFQDLILEVAYKIGCAYYGSTGTGAPQVPIDAHDLALCSNIVNKAIRMFINDGPSPNGWTWLKPIAQVEVWTQTAAASTYPLTSTAYNATTNLTTLAGSTTLFYPSMELKQIWLGGNPPSTTPGFMFPSGQSTATGTPFTIVNYLSGSTIQVYGKPAASTLTGGWAMIADGDYTLPADFSGQYAGAISYVSNTNRGMTLHWTDEASIRQRRQNYNFETGTPYHAAVRLMPTPSLPSDYAPSRRRWQLMTWRISSEHLSILFPYTLGFQSLVNLTDTPPSPFSHDEALKAACLAQAEFDVENVQGLAWNYYKTDALRKSWRIDAMTAPKKLGYFGNPSARNRWGSDIEQFRDLDYQRPTVNMQ